MLDGTPKFDILTIPHDVQQLQQQIPHTSVNVRWSTRPSIPLEIFSPSLYYILFSHVGKPKCYDEAMQVDTKIY